MPPKDAFALFDSLTDKQRTTLALAAKHLTSKQIALELDVAPVTIDKRIESLRARLGNIARSELLRLFSEWCKAYDQTIDDPIILGSDQPHRASVDAQRDDLALEFRDSVTFDARAPWDRERNILRPGLKPSDLGVAGKLVIMLLGAAAVMMVAVLCVAFVDALMSILAR